MNKFILTVIGALFLLTASKPVKVACIGDSITYGYGISDRDSLSYPAVLQRLLGERYEVGNFGISARTMLLNGDFPYMKEALFDSVRVWLPDVVTIMLGTNDSKSHNWEAGAERFRADYLSMIDSIRSIDSHPAIYLCLPPWVPQNPGSINDSTIVSGIIPVIEQLAGKRWLEIVDTHSPLSGMEDIYPDLLHPNEAGAEILAQCIYSTMSRYGDSGTPGKRVLFIGDSITDGAWGKADGKPSSKRQHYDGNHIYGHSYASECASCLLAEFPEHRFKFYNRGKSGDTLNGIAGRWDSDVLSVHPDIVSLYVGINDAYNSPEGLDFDAWEALYRSLLDRSLKSDPDIKFVLCTPFVAEIGAVSRRAAFGNLQTTVSHLGSIVRKIASDYGAVLVAVDDEMAGLLSSDASGDGHYWCWDGIHPTYPAHRKISELWIRSAEPLLF